MVNKRSKSVGGWTEDERRIELERLIGVLQWQHDLTRTEALQAVANRFMTALNTVQGWVSKTRDGERSKRAPPSWMVVEILRHEIEQTGMDGMEPYLAKPLPVAQPDETNHPLHN